MTKFPKKHGKRCNIIAELCQNHNGDLNLLKSMVKDAAEAGSDYVKIQSMLADDLSFRDRFETGDGAIKRPYQEEYDRLKPLDLDDDAHYMFIEECLKYNVKPLTTAFNRTRIDFLANLPWPEMSIKISSFDCRSHKMIQELIDAGFKKFFISTGTTYDSEIKETASILKDAGVEFTLFHCVSIYPSSPDTGHLNRINFLRKFSKSIGFSEHSCYDKDGLKLAIASLAYDVDYIERHFTILPKESTKDGVVSLNKKEMKELSSFCQIDKEYILEYIEENIPDFDLMKGSKKRELTYEEIRNRDYYQGRFLNREEDKTFFNWE